MKGIVYPKDFNPWGDMREEERMLSLNPHLCTQNAEAIVQRFLQRIRSEQQGEVG